MKKNNHVDYTQKVLEVKNLRKYFYVGAGKNKLTVPAVDDVSFDIYKKEVFGLVGESGCGKTTTGRTIIKLYSPTDGTVDINGERITAGYLTQKNNIARIKKEMNEAILYYHPVKLKTHQIKQAAKQEIEYLNYDIRKVREELKLQIENEKRIIENHRTDIYRIKNMQELTIENINKKYLHDKEVLLDSTTNRPEKDYKQRIKIAENTYQRKIQGLKDSAALEKEIIDARIVVLEQDYQKQLEEIKEQYRPLIEKAELEKKSKELIQPELQSLKTQKISDIEAYKVEYKEKLDNLVAPNQEEIKQNIADAKLKANQKINDIKSKIKAIKQKSYEDIQQLNNEDLHDSVIDIDSEEQKAAIQKIKLEAKEAIEKEKQVIRFIKESNRDKKSLEASRQMQMIFQDPISSLNPRMTVREIIGEGLIVQNKYTKEEIEERVIESLKLVGLSPDFVARYPHEFSGGQRQRIGIARALIMNPNFIIADEPISSLDVSIRAQIINLLTELRKELGLTILFIAHDLSVVRFFCDRIAVMYYGKIVEMADSEELFAHPLHPYTESLLSAIPQPDPDYEKGRKKIHYDPRMHDYRSDKPSLREIAPGHSVYVNDQEFEQLKIKYEEQQKQLNKVEQPNQTTKEQAKPTKSKKEVE